ncbi:MAG: STAS domain-containing protein [Chloroflexi bacterium]|nr:STAS domain-containing protein [Chloroflexota bacterium]
MAEPFVANVRSHDGAAILDLRGEINLFAEQAMNAAYTQAAQLNAKTILLNFRDVTYINSTGIALVVGLMAQARKSGRKLLATGLSDHYQEIFKITRLADFMTIYADEERALSEVRN